jgi:5,10-methenyltetrahydromethanopterin hydrogenase
MMGWEYKVTNHMIEELKKCVDSPDTKKTIACDEAGTCMVNDVCKIGTEALASVLNERGKEGWELIMTEYHHGELLCIWKRPEATQ